eukprot:scaffold22663_cov63-Phaeocystis_antarctica.AAC.2
MRRPLRHADFGVRVATPPPPANEEFWYRTQPELRFAVAVVAVVPGWSAETARLAEGACYRSEPPSSARSSLPVLERPP